MATTVSESDRQILRQRLAEVGLADSRFIPVKAGSKASKIDHTAARNRVSGFDSIQGNYGVYAGGSPENDRWLIDVDIDDYDDDYDDEALEAVEELPETLTVKSPHTDGVTGGHRYYCLPGEVPEILKSLVDPDDPTVPEAIEDVSGAKNPNMSWGEIRVKNQYVVGPGSQLDGCDKEWCDNCSKPDGGRYEIADDRPIAEISLADLFTVLRADESDEEPSQAGEASDVTEDTPEIDGDESHARAVAEHYSNISRYLMHGSDDRSESDFHVCCRMIEHGVDESEAYRLLANNSQSKVDTDDGADDYWSRTWQKAKRKVGSDENTETIPQRRGDGDTRASNPTPNDDKPPYYGIFKEACEAVGVEPEKIDTERTDGETDTVGLQSVLPAADDDHTIADAVWEFSRNSQAIDGTDTQAVVANVVVADLENNGEFFRTDDGRLFYFHDDEKEVYRVDATGNRTLTEPFQGMTFERYNLYAGRFSRNLGKDIKRMAGHDATVKETYQFAHYDSDNSELYITDWANGYHAVTSDGVEWRANGTDVYFLPNDRAESYEYLNRSERPSLPGELPGERPMWLGNGDPLMRLFGNRINYDETAVLGPTEQRKQLYLHLHTLPFIDELNSRPIMAWVGEKGSGKTIAHRSIGKFVYGEDYTDASMSSNKDDFLAKVTNQALAFIDNYDDGQHWANDVLASVATGAAVEKRELFTTNSLRHEVPRCWLSITSRDPPFRRDDVADRSLVFRVTRLESFVGEKDYYNQVVKYRDLLWSTYLDNLQAILTEYERQDTATMSSSHRMADWAIFAKIVADALDVDRVEELLEVMETERSKFALEDERWASLLAEWINDEPEQARKWRSAGDLAAGIEARADDREYALTAAGLGSKLTSYHSQLAELYNLEVDEGGRTNKYRFDIDDDTTATGLSRF